MDAESTMVITIASNMNKINQFMLQNKDHHLKAKKGKEKMIIPHQNQKNKNLILDNAIRNIGIHMIIIDFYLCYFILKLWEYIYQLNLWYVPLSISLSSKVNFGKFLS